jgi:hypothetical protein
MVLNIKQKKIYHQLIKLNNKNLFRLLQNDLKIKIKFGDSNFNDEERDFICVAILTDYGVEYIKEKLKQLKKK